jgi:voltage-gated potassium channel
MQIERTLRRLYLGAGRDARIFRSVMVIVEVAILAFFIVASFLRQELWLFYVELFIGALLLLDFIARWTISGGTALYFRQLSTWSDIVVLVSLFLPLFSENFLFLRVLRAIRLFRSYHVLQDLRRQFSFFRRNADAIEAAVNLVVFIFITSALVYVSEAGRHPKIETFVDALYFTVSTLTTTGFGDIVFTDMWGRLLSVFIMIAGVGLFLRLVQTIFRPERVTHECPACGLSRHEPDAVHCRHCGLVLHIKAEGVDT